MSSLLQLIASLGIALAAAGSIYGMHRLIRKLHAGLPEVPEQLPDPPENHDRWSDARRYISTIQIVHLAALLFIAIVYLFFPSLLEIPLALTRFAYPNGTLALLNRGWVAVVLAILGLYMAIYVVSHEYRSKDAQVYAAIQALLKNTHKINKYTLIGYSSFGFATKCIAVIMFIYAFVMSNWYVVVKGDGLHYNKSYTWAEELIPADSIVRVLSAPRIVTEDGHGKVRDACVVITDDGEHYTFTDLEPRGGKAKWAVAVAQMLHVPHEAQALINYRQLADDASKRAFAKFRERLDGFAGVRPHQNSSLSQFIISTIMGIMACVPLWLTVFFIVKMNSLMPPVEDNKTRFKDLPFSVRWNFAGHGLTVLGLFFGLFFLFLSWGLKSGVRSAITQLFSPFYPDGTFKLLASPVITVVIAMVTITCLSVLLTTVIGIFICPDNYQTFRSLYKTAMGAPGASRMAGIWHASHYKKYTLGWSLLIFFCIQLMSNSYAIFAADQIIVNNFWGYGEYSIPYTDIRQVRASKRFITKKGNRHGIHAVISLKDGRSYSFRDLHGLHNAMVWGEFAATKANVPFEIVPALTIKDIDPDVDKTIGMMWIVVILGQVFMMGLVAYVLIKKNLSKNKQRPGT